MEEKRDEKKICLQCGFKHITPGRPEDEYRQMEICRDQEWLNQVMEEQMLLYNWL